MQKYNILENIEYNENKVSITPMFETATSKEIRIVFKAGQIMKDHKTSFPITVEIVEGDIAFGVESGEVYELKKGDLVALEANVVHNLKAHSNAIVRLSLAKGDSVFRVKAVGAL